MKLSVSIACAHEFILLLYLYQSKTINAAEVIDIVTEKSTNLTKLKPVYPVMWLLVPDLKDKKYLFSRRRDERQNLRWQHNRNSRPQELTKWQEKMISRQREYENAPKNLEERIMNKEDLLRNWEEMLIQQNEEDDKINEERVMVSIEDRNYLRQIPKEPWKWKRDKKRNLYYTDGYYARDFRFPYARIQTRYRPITFQHGYGLLKTQIVPILFEMLSGNKPFMKIEHVKDYDNEYPPKNYLF